jgi:hypothetical protein
MTIVSSVKDGNLEIHQGMPSSARQSPLIA